MLRTPYPAQTMAIMGVSKRWQLARNANVVAECGAGKTLIALGTMLVHSAGRPITGLVIAPPHLVEKWAREPALLQFPPSARANTPLSTSCCDLGSHRRFHLFGQRYQFVAITLGIGDETLKPGAQ
jgi:hypothetical protein